MKRFRLTRLMRVNITPDRSGSDSAEIDLGDVNQEGWMLAAGKQAPRLKKMGIKDGMIGRIVLEVVRVPRRPR